MSEVATTVVSSIAAQRKPFYSWLVPGVFYNQLETVLRDAAFLPGVAKTTDTTGPWDKAGSTRIVHLTDGTTVRETVTSATAPDYFAYRLTEFSSPMIRMLVKEARGQWWFTDSGSGLKAKWSKLGTFTLDSANSVVITLTNQVTTGANVHADAVNLTCWSAQTGSAAVPARAACSCAPRRPCHS
jgi:hypothetical protein